jgi:hypothetical protein
MLPLSRWAERRRTAQRRVAGTQIDIFERAKEVNGQKAKLVFAAVIAEVVATAALALVVREIIVHSPLS